MCLSLLVFEPCQGPWGRTGATVVFLKNAEEGSVLRELMTEWRKQARQSLTADLDEHHP